MEAMLPVSDSVRHTHASPRSAVGFLLHAAALTRQQLDGWINIGGANHANWERITRVIGRPELTSDPRFATNAARMRHLDELVALIAEPLRSRPSTDWIARSRPEGVPVGPVNRIGDMLADP